jgi:uncharacterized protein YcbK (DUF882 family)
MAILTARWPAPLAEQQQAGGAAPRPPAFRPGTLPRREFLKSLGALAAVTAVAGAPTWADAAGKDGPGAKLDHDFWARPRRLWVYRAETKEMVDVVYWQNGQLQEAEYLKLCAIMRDVRQNQATYISLGTLDVLRGVFGYYESMAWKYPFVLTSGFRTVKTNTALSAEGAAKNSMHLYGRALDGYIPGVPVRDVAALGLWFQSGGVGLYPKKNFVHIDDGRKRFWQG